MASAKFAKRSVNHSQMAIWRLKRTSFVAAQRVANQQERHDRGADENDEHHGVLRLQPRIELAQRIEDRRAHDGPVEERPASRLRHGDLL
jgi:hypothetical protein